MALKISSEIAWLFRGYKFAKWRSYMTIFAVWLKGNAWPEVEKPGQVDFLAYFQDVECA